MHLTQVHSSTDSVIHIHVILIREFHTFIISTNELCVQRHHLLHVMSILFQNIHWSHKTSHNLLHDHTDILDNKGQNYMYFSFNIRDFRQLLNSLHPHLQFITRNKKRKRKNSSSNLCLSFLIKYAYKKICKINAHLHTHKHTDIYIYIYIYKNCEWEKLYIYIYIYTHE